MESPRRITLAVGVAMFVDASLYLAVVPLLPRYVERFHLSAFGAGVLVAAYPVAIPVVGLACVPLLPRVGARRIALASSGLMTVATVVFAFAPNIAVLDVARLLQGIASGTVWTASMAWVTHNAPTGRRGRESGIVMGMLSAGSIAGPGVGALAATAGSVLAFLLVAVASSAGLVLTVLAPAGRAVPSEPHLTGAIRGALRQPATRAGLATVLIDSLAFGTIDLLVPLHLGKAGTSSATIAGALALGAVLGISIGPISGRIVDRVGPGRVSLTMGCIVSVSPLLFALEPSIHTQLGLLIVLSPTFAVLGAAMFPLASQGAEAAGVQHIVVNGLQGAVWALGFTLAPLAMGATAQATTDTTAFVLAAILSTPLLAILLRSVRHTPPPIRKDTAG